MAVSFSSSLKWNVEGAKGCRRTPFRLWCADWSDRVMFEDVSGVSRAKEFRGHQVFWKDLFQIRGARCSTETQPGAYGLKMPIQESMQESMEPIDKPQNRSRDLGTRTGVSWLVRTKRHSRARRLWGSTPATRNLCSYSLVAFLAERARAFLMCRLLRLINLHQIPRHDVIWRLFHRFNWVLCIKSLHDSNLRLFPQSLPCLRGGLSSRLSTASTSRWITVETSGLLWSILQKFSA